MMNLLCFTNRDDFRQKAGELLEKYDKLWGDRDDSYATCDDGPEGYKNVQSLTFIDPDLKRVVEEIRFTPFGYTMVVDTIIGFFLLVSM